MPEIRIKTEYTFEEFLEWFEESVGHKPDALQEGILRYHFNKARNNGVLREESDSIQEP